MKKYINLIDVTARDGLQNLKKIIPLNEKINLVNKLTECGFNHIEVGSYVTPKLIQMSNSLEVYQSINKKDKTKYTVLVPSLKKFMEIENKLLPSISTITTVSETFAQKNMNMDIETSIDNINSICKFKKKYPFWLRIYVSCCFGCPFEGDIPLIKLYKILNSMHYNIDEIVISDTIGSISINKLEKVLNMLNNMNVDKNKCALHIHCADEIIPNIIDTALQNDITKFDVSLSNLGGCPYAAKENNYNMSAIKTIEYLEQIGYITDINKEKLIETELWLNKIIK